MKAVRLRKVLVRKIWSVLDYRAPWTIIFVDTQKEH